MSLLELHPVQAIVCTPLTGLGTKFLDFEGYVYVVDVFHCTNFAWSSRDCWRATDTGTFTVQGIVGTPLTQVPLQLKELLARHWHRYLYSSRDCSHATDTGTSTVQGIVGTPVTQVPLQFEGLLARH